MTISKYTTESYCFSKKIQKLKIKKYYSELKKDSFRFFIIRINYNLKKQTKTDLKLGCRLCRSKHLRHGPNSIQNGRRHQFENPEIPGRTVVGNNHKMSRFQAEQPWTRESGSANRRHLLSSLLLFSPSPFSLSRLPVAPMQCNAMHSISTFIPSLNALP